MKGRGKKERKERRLVLLKPQTAPFKPQVGERLRRSGETRGARRRLQGHTGKGYRGRGLRRSLKKTEGGGRRRGRGGGLSPTAQRHHGIASATREKGEAGPAHGGGGTHVKRQSKYSLLTFFSPSHLRGSDFLPLFPVSSSGLAFPRPRATPSATRPSQYDSRRKHREGGKKEEPPTANDTAAVLAKQGRAEYAENEWSPHGRRIE